MWGVCVCVYCAMFPLLQVTGNTTCAYTISASLGRLHHVPLWFKLTPQELHDLSIRCWHQSHVFRCCSLWPYLVMLGVLTVPCDVICPQALMLYKWGVWRLWRTFWSSLSAGISVRIDHQNFFVTEVSLKARLPNYLIVHCFIIHYSALHHLLLLISTNKTYSKPAVLTLQELWLESWISILKCPAQASYQFPSVTSLSQNRCTWFWPLH
jgi:hypothetical protein